MVKELVERTAVLKRQIIEAALSIVVFSGGVDRKQHIRGNISCIKEETRGD